MAKPYDVKELTLKPTKNIAVKLVEAILNLSAKMIAFHGNDQWHCREAHLTLHRNFGQVYISYPQLTPYTTNGLITAAIKSDTAKLVIN